LIGTPTPTTPATTTTNNVLLTSTRQVDHPDVEAVASGAIASDYQRLRVEDVCARLGLVSLGYLWHRPQEELLRSALALHLVEWTLRCRLALWAHLVSGIAPAAAAWHAVQLSCAAPPMHLQS